MLSVVSAFMYVDISIGTEYSILSLNDITEAMIMRSDLMATSHLLRPDEMFS